jgi:3-oxoadipate enol-lactonase
MTRLLTSPGLGGNSLPLLLIHGISAGPDCWGRCLPLLAPEGPVLLADLAGPDHDATRFSLHAAAEALASELALRAARSALVIGHSMGGLIGILLATEHPELVCGLVLVDTPALPLPGGLVGRSVAVLRSTRHTDAGSMPTLVAGLCRMGPRRLRVALHEMLTIDLRDRLVSLATPTLLVWGVGDTIVPVAVGRQMEALIPGARLALVDEADHMPMWERPTAFAAAVGAFVAGAAVGVS